MSNLRYPDGLPMITKAIERGALSAELIRDWMNHPYVSHSDVDKAIITWLLDALAAQREALALALSALPDSSDGGPKGNGYRYAWDELTGEEQEWVKDARAKISAALATSPKEAR